MRLYVGAFLLAFFVCATTLRLPSCGLIRIQIIHFLYLLPMATLRQWVLEGEQKYGTTPRTGKGKTFAHTVLSAIPQVTEDASLKIKDDPVGPVKQKINHYRPKFLPYLPPSTVIATFCHWKALGPRDIRSEENKKSPESPGATDSQRNTALTLTAGFNLLFFSFALLLQKISPHTRTLRTLSCSFLGVKRSGVRSSQVESFPVGCRQRMAALTGYYLHQSVTKTKYGNMLSGTWLLPKPKARRDKHPFPNRPRSGGHWRLCGAYEKHKKFVSRTSSWKKELKPWTSNRESRTLPGQKSSRNR